MTGILVQSNADCVSLVVLHLLTSLGDSTASCQFMDANYNTAYPPVHALSYAKRRAHPLK